MEWEASNGQPAVIEKTGLYIDGEFLQDEPAVLEMTTPENVPYAGSENESN